MLYEQAFSKVTYDSFQFFSYIIINNKVVFTFKVLQMSFMYLSIDIAYFLKFYLRK